MLDALPEVERNASNIIDAASFDAQPVTSEASNTTSTEEMAYDVEYVPEAPIETSNTVMTSA
jgi:hypothetical protein